MVPRVTLRVRQLRWSRDRIRCETRPMTRSALLVGSVLAAGVFGCTKDDKPTPAPATSAPTDAGTAAPKSLDMAKAALASARAKYAKHEAGDADCAPLTSLAADFATDKSPDAVKTTREVQVFCAIDVKLEGSVATLKADHEKLTAAQKKRDRTGEQMYAATVREGCASIRKQLEFLTSDKLDTEPKVGPLKADAERVCASAK